MSTKIGRIPCVFQSVRRSRACSAGVASSTAHQPTHTIRTPRTPRRAETIPPDETEYSQPPATDAFRLICSGSRLATTITRALRCSSHQRSSSPSRRLGWRSRSSSAPSERRADARRGGGGDGGTRIGRVRRVRRACRAFARAAEQAAAEVGDVRARRAGRRFGLLGGEEEAGVARGEEEEVGRASASSSQSTSRSAPRRSSQRRIHTSTTTSAVKLCCAATATSRSFALRRRSSIAQRVPRVCVARSRALVRPRRRRASDGDRQPHRSAPTACMIQSNLNPAQARIRDQQAPPADRADKDGGARTVDPPLASSRRRRQRRGCRRLRSTRKRATKSPVCSADHGDGALVHYSRGVAHGLLKAWSFSARRTRPTRRRRCARWPLNEAFRPRQPIADLSRASTEALPAAIAPTFQRGDVLFTINCVRTPSSPLAGSDRLLTPPRSAAYRCTSMPTGPTTSARARARGGPRCRRERADRRRQLAAPVRRDGRPVELGAVVVILENSRAREADGSSPPSTAPTTRASSTPSPSSTSSSCAFFR